MRLALAAAATLLLFALMPAPARAAQDALVTVEQAAIREMPSLDAKIIETKPTGSTVRVSSFAKDGWYRIRSNLGQFGWIWQGDIRLNTYTSDTKAASLDFPERPHEARPEIATPLFYFRGGLNIVSMFSQVGETSPSLNLAAGGYFQTALRLRDDLRLAVRIMNFADAFQISDFSNPTDLTGSATAAMIGFEQNFYSSEANEWWVGMYGGIDLASSITGNTGVTNTFGLAPSYGGVALNSDATSMTISSTGYAFLFTFGYAHHFSTWLSLVAEGGVFYNYIPALDLPAFGTQHLSEFGPIFSVGLQINLNL